MKSERVNCSGFDPRRGGYFGLEYQWVFNDGGRAGSKRPRQNNDCTVRALAISFNRDYDDVYDELKTAGRKCSRGFFFTDWAKEHVLVRTTKPAVKGECRYCLSDFCRDHPKGIYIIQVARHVFAVVNGVVQDTFRERPDRCVYSFWLITGWTD